jgi:hypothetical protein
LRERVLLAALCTAACASATSCFLGFEGLTGGPLPDDGGTGEGSGGTGGDSQVEAAETGDAADASDADSGDGACSFVGCDICAETCDGSSCTVKTVDAVAGAGPAAQSIARTSTALYWLAFEEKSIYRQTSDSGPTPVATNLSQTPEVLAASDTDLVWFNASEGLNRCDLPACATKTTGFVPSATSLNVFQMLIDGPHLYWIPGPGFSAAKVQRVLADGTFSTPTVLAFNQEKPAGIAVDATHVYWSIPGSGGADGAIRRVDKSTTATDPDAGVADYISGLVSPAALTIAQGFLYFTRDAQNGHVFRCELATGCSNVSQLTPNGSSTPAIRNPRSLAVDSTRVYWTNDEDETVMYCPITGCGGSLLNIAAEYQHPAGLVQSETCLFWIERIQIDGGGTETHVQTSAKPR